MKSDFSVPVVSSGGTHDCRSREQTLLCVAELCLAVAPGRSFGQTTDAVYSLMAQTQTSVTAVELGHTGKGLIKTRRAGTVNLPPQHVIRQDRNSENEEDKAPPNQVATMAAKFSNIPGQQSTKVLRNNSITESNGSNKISEKVALFATGKFQPQEEDYSEFNNRNSQDFSGIQEGGVGTIKRIFTEKKQAREESPKSLRRQKSQRIFDKARHFEALASPRRTLSERPNKPILLYEGQPEQQSENIGSSSETENDIEQEPIARLSPSEELDGTDSVETRRNLFLARTQKGAQPPTPTPIQRDQSNGGVANLAALFEGKRRITESGSSLRRTQSERASAPVSIFQVHSDEVDGSGISPDYTENEFDYSQQPSGRKSPAEELQEIPREGVQTITNRFLASNNDGPQTPTLQRRTSGLSSGIADRAAIFENKAKQNGSIRNPTIRRTQSERGARVANRLSIFQGNPENINREDEEEDSADGRTSPPPKPIVDVQDKVENRREKYLQNAKLNTNLLETSAVIPSPEFKANRMLFEQNQFGTISKKNKLSLTPKRLDDRWIGGDENTPPPLPTEMPPSFDQIDNEGGNRDNSSVRRDSLGSPGQSPKPVAATRAFSFTKPENSQSSMTSRLTPTTDTGSRRSSIAAQHGASSVARSSSMRSSRASSISPTENSSTSSRSNSRASSISPTENSSTIGGTSVGSRLNQKFSDRYGSSD